MNNSTTDLSVIRKNVKTAPFTWGKPIRLHEVGRYSILEFHPWKVDGVTLLTGTPDLKVREWHGWVSGRDASMSFNSLDAAMVGLVAYRHDGPNSQAAMYFMRSLNRKM